MPEPNGNTKDPADVPEQDHLNARQQRLSSHGSTDPPPAYSSHDQTSPNSNQAPISGFRAGLNAVTNAISKTLCGTGSVAASFPVDKPTSATEKFERTDGKGKRPNKNCVGCVNCEGCKNCVLCRDCIDCHNCTDCTDCVRCHNCTGCTGLTDAHNAVGEHG